MAVTIRDLLVRLGVKAETRKLKQFDASMVSIAGSARTAVKTTLALGAAVVGAATLGTAALFSLTRGYADTADEAAKAAARTGITAQEFQELTFAATEAGASMQDVETAMRRQAVSARDAALGVGTAAKAYKRLGIDVNDSSGNLKPQLALFTESADAISKVKGETEKLALANDLFGRGGAKLLPLLNAGAEGMDALRQRARDLGIVIGDDAAKAAEEFNDRLFEASSAVVGLRNDFAQAFIPTFTRVLVAFRDWFIANRAIIRQRVERVAERIRAGLEALGRTVVAVDAFVRDRIGGWKVLFVAAASGVTALVVALTGLKVVFAITSGVTALTTALTSLAALLGLTLLPTVGVVALALGAMFVVFLPIILEVVGVVVLIGLAFEDLIVFLRGGDSVIGRFIATFLEGNAVWEALVRLLKAVIAEFWSFMSVLGLVAAIFVELLTPAWILFRDAVLAGVKLLVFAVASLVEPFLLLAGINIDDLLEDLDLMTAAVNSLRAAEEGLRDILQEGLDIARKFSATIQELSKQGNLIEMGFGAAGDLLFGAGAGVAPTGSDSSSRTTNNNNTSISSPSVNVTTNDPGAMRAEAEALFAEERRAAAASFAGAEV